MKLTQDERYTAYCIMLQEAERRVYTREECNEAGYTTTDRRGLCKLSRIVIGMRLEEWAVEIVNRYYFLHSHIWEIHDWKPRIELLKQCIIETETF
jgi:hypothetical protein